MSYYYTVLLWKIGCMVVSWLQLTAPGVGNTNMGVGMPIYSSRIFLHVSPQVQLSQITRWTDLIVWKQICGLILVNTACSYSVRTASRNILRSPMQYLMRRLRYGGVSISWPTPSCVYVTHCSSTNSVLWTNRCHIGWIMSVKTAHACWVWSRDSV